MGFEKHVKFLIFFSSVINTIQKTKILLTIAIILSFSLSFIQFNANPAFLTNHQTILATNPKTSTYTSSAPIAITSDSDWHLYASGGSGMQNNPWVIQDLYIDCGGTGTGINISSTNDYAMFKDCFVNNSGSGGSDFAILDSNANNIEFQDILINRTGNLGIGLAGATNILIDSCSINDSNNNAVLMIVCNDVTINNCYINKTSVSQAITISDCNNILINNSRIDGITGNCVAEIESSEFIGHNSNITVQNTILNVANGCEGFTVRDTTLVRAYNDTFNGGMGFDDNSGTCSNIIVNDSLFNNSYSHAVRCIDSFIVDNCRFINPYASVNPYVITVHGVDNYTIERCYFQGCWGIGIEGAGNNKAFILNNTFMSNATDPTNNQNNGIETGSTNYMTIEYNYFVNCSPPITIGSTINDTIEHNWFYNNFADELSYLSTYDPGNYGFGLTVLKENYYRDYFTRFPSANLVNASTGILDEKYIVMGIGATARYDPEPLYWAPWFPRTDSITWAIYSSIDGLGIDMDWFKVNVNGFPVYNHVVQISSVLYSISVQDFANRTYYYSMFNVNSTKSIYVAIPITTLNVFNNGTSDAYFYFTRNNLTTVFVISPGQVYSLRVIVGMFSYTVKYANGTVIKSRNGVLYSKIAGNITGPTAITINFGFTKVSVPTIPQSSSFTWFDTIISITVFAIIAIVAIILYVIVYNRKSISRVKEQEHLRHRNKI